MRNFAKVSMMIMLFNAVLLLYTGVATVSYSYIVDNEKLNAYNLCVSNRLTRMAENPSSVLLISECEARFNFDNAGAAAIVWPISVPIVFAMRHPIGIILVVNSGLLGAFGVVGGVSVVTARRKRQIEREEAADRLIRQDSPDLLT